MAAEVITFNQSRVKTFNRCPKQYEYKYIQLLQPKRKARPLFLGSWIHRAIETHYVNGDWKIGHQEYVDLWNKLFDEERAELGKRSGPLPNTVARIMRSYAWYYRVGDFKPVMTEFLLEAETPLVLNGKRVIFKGRGDLLASDEAGDLWFVDHKSAGTIPQPTSYHGMDPQLILYPWAFKVQHGLDVRGVIYNYIRSKAPSEPQLLKSGGLSRRRVSTDYPTLITFLKRNNFDPADFVDVLKPLYKRSDFLRRYRLPREDYVTKEILLDALSVVKRANEAKRFTRSITRDCQMCPYHDLCRSELNGFDTTIMRKKYFDVGEEDYVASQHSGNSDNEETEEENSGDDG